VATLAANAKRAYEAGYEPCFNDFPMVASDIVYEGAAVGDAADAGTGTDGYAHPIDASDVFLGFADSKADNSSGAAGAINCRVRQRGAVSLAVTGVTGTSDVGATVYCTDDNTFTLTASGGIAIGKIIRHVSSTTVIVYFEGAQLRSI
jgi:hypothetical protein